MGLALAHAVQVDTRFDSEIALVELAGSLPIKSDIRRWGGPYGSLFARMLA
jgi:hypothetical protein